MNKDYDKCLFCGGTDINRSRQGVWLDDENKTVTVDVECENCGKDYEEVYRFEKKKKCD
jgi:ribosomal protein L37AE/L43A